MHGDSTAAVVAPTPADSERDAAAVKGVVARTPMQIAWSRLKRDRVAWLSTAFILLLIAFALAAPLIKSWTGHGPDYQDQVNGINDQGLPSGIGENGYILGASDVNGHDMLVWLAYGARVSLLIGFVSTALVLVISLLAGVTAGYFGGWIDTLLTRFMDIIAAFPFLLFGIALSIVFGTGHLWLMIVIITFFSWFYPARIFRSDVLALREREFVEAARAMGAGNWRIMRRHLLPHLVPPLVVYGTLSIAAAISFEAAIDFLGFGLTIDTPSWGQMINLATGGGFYQLAPRLMLIPGAFIFLTVLAFNLLGDSLRDALDPRGGIGG
jgi:peptide/nickel transport system permease protein